MGRALEEQAHNFWETRKETKSCQGVVRSRLRSNHWQVDSAKSSVDGTYILSLWPISADHGLQLMQCTCTVHCTAASYILSFQGIQGSISDYWLQVDSAVLGNVCFPCHLASWKSWTIVHRSSTNFVDRNLLSEITFRCEFLSMRESCLMNHRYTH